MWELRESTKKSTYLKCSKKILSGIYYLLYILREFEFLDNRFYQMINFIKIIAYNGNECNEYADTKAKSIINSEEQE